MILTSTSDIVRVVTSSTADIHVQASWADITTSAFTPGRTNTVITTATTTTIVASPGASTQRQIKTIVIYNAHGSTANTVTVQLYDGSTSSTVYKYALAAGESVEYDGSKWTQFDANGVSKSTTSLGVLTSAQLAGALTDETGSGAAVFATSPTLVTPALGTPSALVLTNATGLPVAGGGTGVSSVTTSPTASSFAGWDGNKNLSADSFISGYTTTATSAGTTTLTVDSTYQQFFTGTSTHTVVLPVTSTLVLGQSFLIVNNSNQTIQLQSSGANTVQSMARQTWVVATCILTSGTSETSWAYSYSPYQSGIVGTGSTVRATSPTLTTPNIGTPSAGVLTNCTGLPVAGGGTGIATTTAYSVICAGTTATGPFQSLANLGPSGAKLTSNGAGALPSFKGGKTSFSACNGSDQTITTATPTKISLSTELFDNGGMFDSSTNYRFTPTIEGYYLFIGKITFYNTMAAGTTCLTRIYKNGSGVFDGQLIVAVTNTYTQPIAATILYMDGSTDYVELYGYHDAGSNKNTLGGVSSTLLSGCLLETQ